jgi:hypothetical protein
MRPYFAHALDRLPSLTTAARLASGMPRAELS